VDAWIVEVDGRAVGFMCSVLAIPQTSRLRWTSSTSIRLSTEGDRHLLIDKVATIARERGLKALTVHTAVKNGGMTRFSAENSFEIRKLLKSFWGEGTGDACLLTKHLLQWLESLEPRSLPGREMQMHHLRERFN